MATQNNRYPYTVTAPDGSLVLQAAEGCRHNRRIELDLLEHGYTIRLHSIRVTKKDVRSGGAK